jgi:hypothetical protein
MEIGDNGTDAVEEDEETALTKLFEQRHNDFLVNLRSPLDRIASWFIYEHTENHGIGTYVARYV